MRAKLQTEDGRSIYKMRKAIVEPVFGQIKQVRNIRQFSLRGIKQVTAEWDLITLTHNLLKLFRSGWKPPVKPMTEASPHIHERESSQDVGSSRRVEHPAPIPPQSPVAWPPASGPSPCGWVCHWPSGWQSTPPTFSPRLKGAIYGKARCSPSIY